MFLSLPLLLSAKPTYFHTVNLMTQTHSQLLPTLNRILVSLRPSSLPTWCPFPGLQKPLSRWHRWWPQQNPLIRWVSCFTEAIQTQEVLSNTTIRLSTYYNNKLIYWQMKYRHVQTCTGRWTTERWSTVHVMSLLVCEPHFLAVYLTPYQGLKPTGPIYKGHQVC